MATEGPLPRFQTARRVDAVSPRAAPTASNSWEPLPKVAMCAGRSGCPLPQCKSCRRTSNRQRVNHPLAMCCCRTVLRSSLQVLSSAPGSPAAAVLRGERHAPRRSTGIDHLSRLDGWPRRALGHLTSQPRIEPANRPYGACGRKSHPPDRRAAFT